MFWGNDGYSINIQNCACLDIHNFNCIVQSTILGPVCTEGIGGGKMKHTINDIQQQSIC